MAAVFQPSVTVVSRPLLLPKPSFLRKRTAFPLSSSCSLPSRLPFLRNLSLSRRLPSDRFTNGEYFMAQRSVVSSSSPGENGVPEGSNAEPSIENIDALHVEQGVVQSRGSSVWALGPLALIASMTVPQFILPGFIEATIKEEIIAEALASFSLDIFFYVGLAAFLLVAEHVQQPYHQRTRWCWSLMSGHTGYLYSTYLTLGLKVLLPLVVSSLAFPAIGLPTIVALGPFLLGLAIQYVYEHHLQSKGSSAWPLWPIVFEVYRIYQLTKGAQFVQKLFFSVGRAAGEGLPEKRRALVCTLLTLQVLGLVCVWSLATFLLRLIPWKPEAETSSV